MIDDEFNDKKLEDWSEINNLYNVAVFDTHSFDPEIHVPMAQRIVDVFDEKIGYTRAICIKERTIKEDIWGSTIAVRDYGIDEEKIGHYVVTKHKSHGCNRLEIEYAIPDEIQNSEINSTTLLLYYRTLDKKLQSIKVYTHNPKVIRIGRMRLEIGITKPKTLWEIDRSILKDFT